MYVAKNVQKMSKDYQSQPQRDVFSIDVNDYNSSSTLNPLKNDPNISNFGIQPSKPRSGFKFNRTFLIMPLIAFLIVALLAAIFGIVFGQLYQPSEISNELSKDQDSQNDPQFTTYLTTLIPITISTEIPAATTITSDIISTQTEFSETTLITNETTTTSLTTINDKLTEVCGRQTVQPNLKQLRIIRGSVASKHSWPWAVSIGYNGPKKTMPHACGGTLINKRTVVTATHCVKKESIFDLVGNPLKDSKEFNNLEHMIRVYVGVTKRSTDVNSRTTFRVSKIISHQNFEGKNFKNDISIIILDRDVDSADPAVGFICLDKITQTTPNTKVFAVGWGFTEDNWFKASDDLMQISFPIQSKENCGLKYLPVLQFCAGDRTKKKDTCNGDSGGPIMTYVDNRYVLTGIVSNGDPACLGKGIYTNVSHYYDWLSENIYLQKLY